jgi:hypothetical protein
VSEIRRIGIRMGIKKNENFDLDTSGENILLHLYLRNFDGMCLKSTLCKTNFFSKVSIATLVPSRQTVWSWLAEETELPQIHNKRATSTTCKLSKLQRLMGNFLTSRVVVERESLTSKRPYFCERPTISSPTAHRI